MARDVATTVKRYKEGISSTKYEKGVNAVSISPTASAVKRKETYIKKVIEGKDRLVNNLKKVSIDKWRDKMRGAFSKLQEKAIRAADTGKYPAAKVIEAAKAAHEAAMAIPKESLNDSLKRYLAAQAAIKAKYNK